MLKPKVGDFVRLKPMTVVEIGEDNSVCLIDCASWKRHESLNLIEEILPRPLAVGDTVCSANSSMPGAIKAIVDLNAWVRWENGRDQVHSLGFLKRTDPGA